MKQRILFSIALAGLMLGSCSKDAIDGGNGASWNENGEGFISLSLNIPATTGTASRANGDFVDGEAGEFAVNDAILLLFANENESEADATFNSAYNLGMGNWQNNGNATDQITSTARIVQQINEITESNIYALVVLNANDVIVVTEENKLTVGGSAWTAGTLANLNEAVAKVTEKGTWSTKGYLMSNSPLFSAAGGSTQPSGGKVSTLAKIDPKMIFPTAAEATANPAGTIFVERAQAKVQVVNETATSGRTNTFTIEDGAGNDVKYTYTLANWALDNYNTQSKLTREFDNTWAGYTNSLLTTANYRFVDDQVVKTDCGYRTYWGKDVNYEKSTLEEGATGPKLDNQAGSATPTVGNTFGSSVYCLENTSSSNMPNANELTRIIVKATLSKGDNNENPDDFFIVGNDRSTIYLDVEAASDGSIQNRIKEFVLSNQGVRTAISGAEPTSDFTESNLTVTLNLTDKNSGILNNKNDITVALTGESEIGIDETEKGTIETAIKNALYSETDEYKNNIEIDFYKDGVCYYDAFIRHFNDGEAPLESEDGTKDAQVNDPELLGRYGVVRNNWYVLNVNSVKGIGDSTVPELPAKPVDEKEFFLSVEINIMPWVMRSQDVDL